MKYTLYRSIFLYTYLLASVLLSGALVFIYSDPSNAKSVLENSFIYMMFFSNMVAFYQTRQYLDLYSQSDRPMALFSFQFLLFVFIAAQKNDWSLIYLTEIPLIMGVIFKVRENRIGHQILLKQILLISAIGLISQVISHEIFFKTGSVFEKVILNINSLWKLIPLVGVYSFYREKNSRKKNNTIHKNIIENDGPNPKDSLFFHDMINSTHGLILFLTNKIKSYESQELSRNDLKGVLDEVKTMQSLLKDHFSYQHKNLENDNHMINIKNAIDKSITMIKHYLPTEMYQTEIMINGLENHQDQFIYYPSFYRILNNIVKNISDKKSEQIEFIFKLENNNIEITVRNSIYHLNKNQMKLSENLSEIIRNTEETSFDNESKGLGLQSIMNLCHEQGGYFKFFIEEGNWVSKVYLPLLAINKKSVA